MGKIFSKEKKTINIKEEEFRQYLKSAEEGNGDAQLDLGHCYIRGIGTMKDEEKAFQWYLKSAEGGNSLGQYNIGNCYSNGIGTTKDEVKAFQWYLKSAEGGDSDAQFNLGRFYSNGIGTVKDKKKAFQWYMKSAERGDSGAQLNLGYCYENGTGITKDEEKAFQWYMKSAEGGNSLGQFNIGSCYSNGIGTKIDEVKAFQWYLKSAEGGDSDAQFNLGRFYSNGIGTIKDKKKAFQWYMKSAEGGDSDAQFNLGLFYSNGIGITKDKKKAFQWYLKSAEGGDSDAQFNLGYCYLNGIGTTKDEVKAFQWYLKSAEGGGVKFGQRSLEYFYRNEISNVKKNQKESMHRCHNCENLNIQNNTCSNCKWTSGNHEIDKIIQMTQSDENANEWEIWRWIDYSKLKNIEYLAEGGFGSIWKAEWIDMPEEVFEFYKSNQVALKKLKNSQEISSGFLKELTANFQCRDKYVLPILGITQDSMTHFSESMHRCHNCENLNIQNNTCSNCKWTSGNHEIDKIIQMTQSDENANEWEIWRWIDYSKLKNIEYLAEGGFGSIWKAEWIDMPEEVFEFYKSNQVALKKLKNSQEISSGFLKELTANFQCRDKYVLPILGITQDSMTKEYAIVLRHMKNGNLRDFLNQNKSLPWIERIWLLNSFIRGLKVIHSKRFVHHDLHPGNLMITEAYSNSKYKFIRLGDLGLCRLANETSSSGAYGVLPYIAPEVFNKHQYSQASDIYSVGMIMWIISTGKKPFANRAYDRYLAVDIFNGLRPKINKSMPQCYIELMKKCWHKDPAERPSAEMIYDISEKWISDLLYDHKTENTLMFLNADQRMHENVEDLSSAETTHPEANVICKLLPSDFNKFHVDNLNFDGR
ncbi:hypothetical protein Glove_692g54 [Diversispora epigaea]|uniref:Protein kinase domain-containing protein n=1 Tax=Diversispora epigaea TaxID=1348612 RepID=A0A397G643_9GLOM|nr:hypothetical protein Glove_692g54 [Diversispora epigaea]